MNWEEKIKEHLSVGKQLNNPGGGISTISKIDNEKISYIRGKSAITLYYKDIENVYLEYAGGTCTASDLKLFNPKVFDSKNGGHSCNCTFIFMVFEELQLLQGSINGLGVRGNPYYIHIK